MGDSKGVNSNLISQFSLDERRESDVQWTINRLLDEIDRKEQSINHRSMMMMKMILF